MSKEENEQRFSVLHSSPIIPRISHKDFGINYVIPKATKTEKINDFVSEIFVKLIMFLGGCVLIIASIYTIILFGLGIQELFNV